MKDVNLDEFHWLLEIVQSMDVGIIVIDRDYRVEVWNGFIEHHSGHKPSEVTGQSLFELFPEIDRDWFVRKVESVALLGIPAFTIWEQRPYLLRFNGYQPITGREPYMYQNTTFLPLTDSHGVVAHIALIIYDVTRVAVNSQQLRQANGELQRLSRTDRLTGLLNRGYWEECLAIEFSRFQRYQHPVTLIIFDIDHFKRINDTHGHQAGDAVIRQVAEITRQQVRGTDVCGRYGGEEFVVLLPDTPADGALLLAERLRKNVEQCVVEHGGVEIRFTISLGVAALTLDCGSHAALIEQADSALYRSKEGGRNRCTVHDNSLPKH